MMQNIVEDNSLYFDSLAFVAEETGVNMEDLIGLRKYPLPIYRFGIYSLLRKWGWSWMRIERATGKTHASVMHGIETLRDLVQTKNEKALFIVNLLNNFMSYNHITVVGNIGADAEVSDYDNRYLIRFKVCTTNRYKKGEEWVNDSQWFNVQMWGTSASQGRLLTKGAQVLVDGSMKSKEYEKDGEKKTYWYIAASSFQILSGAKKNESEQNPKKGDGGSHAAAPQGSKPAAGDRKINLDDVPY